MKRAPIVCLALLILLCTSTLSASAVERVVTRVKDVEVSVDPRMELLAAVQLLTTYGKYGPIRQEDFQYRRDMQKYFAPYKDHRAVVLFERMCWKGFSCDAPIELMLCVSDPPTLKPQSWFHKKMHKTAQLHGIDEDGQRSIREFLEALRDFAEVSDFDRFYSEHCELYKSIVHDVASRLERVKIVESFEAYFGSDAKMSYRLVLMPLSAGSYGPNVERPRGVKELYVIMGPAGIRDDTPLYALVDHICGMVWHELGHSFVNPLSEEHRAVLEQYASLLDAISNKRIRQVYPTWESCVNEQILHAVTARLYEDVRGDKAARSFLAWRRASGFVHIDALCKRLEEYEKNRDKYPTFESFYPQLLDVFKQLQEQNPGPEFYRGDTGK